MLAEETRRWRGVKLFADFHALMDKIRTGQPLGPPLLPWYKADMKRKWLGDRWEKIPALAS